MGGVVLLFFGAVALVMGGVFGTIGWQSRQSAIHAAELPRLTATEIGRQAAGREGVVEGVLSEDNPTFEGGFVFYYRSRLRGFETRRQGMPVEHAERRPQWQPIDRHLPPLKVKTEEGEVWIFGEYSVTFKGSDRSWVSTETLEVGTSERYEGLDAGQTVTAVGRVAAAPQGWGLETVSLASGSYQEYLAGERGSATFGLIAGAVLLLVGGVLVALGIGVLSS